MSDSILSTADLDPRRRKLLFRAWHRGIKEMDLIFGRFADAHLAAMPETDLDEFEMMLETSDRDLIKWFIGEEEVPSVADTPLFRRIAAHALDTQSHA
ncbi:MAG: succinate dehydrogenase assembly factor 2 [Rhizobiaceae bacterium]